MFWPFLRRLRMQLPVPRTLCADFLTAALSGFSDNPTTSDLLEPSVARRIRRSFRLFKNESFPCSCVYIFKLTDNFNFLILFGRFAGFSTKLQLSTRKILANQANRTRRAVRDELQPKQTEPNGTERNRERPNRITDAKAESDGDTASRKITKQFTGNGLAT